MGRPISSASAAWAYTASMIWLTSLGGSSGRGVGRMVQGFSLPEPTRMSVISAFICRALVANSIM